MLYSRSAFVPRVPMDRHYTNECMPTTEESLSVGKQNLLARAKGFNRPHWKFSVTIHLWVFDVVLVYVFLLTPVHLLLSISFIVVLVAVLCVIHLLTHTLGAWRCGGN